MARNMKVGSILCALLTLFSFSIAYAAEPNLLLNPGFESGMTSWVNWKNSSVVSNNQKSGARSMRAGVADGGFAQTLKNLVVGKKYKLTFYGKKSNSSLSAKGGLKFYDVNWKELTTSSEVIFDTTAYKIYSVEFVPPVGTVHTSAYGYKWGGDSSSYAYFDDFHLSLIPPPTVIGTNDSFASLPFSKQSKSFEIIYDATPSTLLEGLVGLGNVSAQGFSDLATSVRFNTTGKLDVMSAGGYVTGSNLSYKVGVNHRFRLLVDPISKKYRVYVKIGSGTEQVLINEANFRTTQSTLSELSYMTSWARGSVQLKATLISIKASDENLGVIECSAGYELSNNTCVKKVLNAQDIIVVSSSDDGNVAENVLDGSFATRWSAEGTSQWIELRLKDVYLINSVHIAFYNGNLRKSKFRVQLSSDGTVYEEVFAGESSGLTLGLESFNFTEKAAKFVRVIGEGNSINAWNSYTELVLNKPSSTTQPGPAPAPSPEPINGSNIPLNQVDLIFTNDLERRPLGTYSASDFQAEWNTGAGNRIDKLSVLSTSNNKSLRVDYPYYDKPSTGFKTTHSYLGISGDSYIPKGTGTLNGLGSHSGGAGFNTKLNKSYEEIYFGFRLFVPLNFDGVHSGKLLGVCGGICSTGGRSTDPDGDGTSDGFSTRFLFSDLKTKPLIYMYHKDHMGNPCSTCAKKYGTVLNSVENTTTQDIPFVKGQWNTLIQRVVMNTLNQSNGIVEVWLNGDLIIQKSNIQFRVGTESKFGIDTMYFSTFFGGGAVNCSTSNPPPACRNDRDDPNSGVLRYSGGDVMLHFAPRKDEHLLIDDLNVFLFKSGVSVPRGHQKSPVTRKVYLPVASGYLLLK